MRRGLASTSLALLLLIVFASVVHAAELAPGDRGPDVQRAQQALADRGYDVGLVDGIYGNRTRNAVRAFQLDVDLSPTGEIDATTWTLLFATEVIEEIFDPEEDREPEESAVEDLVDDFDLSDWGMGGGSSTSLELRGRFMASAAGKIQDSSTRFPSTVVLADPFGNPVDGSFSAIDEPGVLSHQQSFASFTLDGSFPGRVRAQATFDISHHATDDRPFEDRAQYEVDEAYLRKTGDVFSWTIGKQKMNWGAMDVISPFNVINSADLLEPFVHGGLHTQRGQWGLHLNVDKVDDFRLEAFFVPVWNGSLVPQAQTDPDDFTVVEADQWVPPVFSSIPAFVFLDAAYFNEFGQPVAVTYINTFDGIVEPEKDIESFSLSLRGLKTAGRWDLGAYFITTPDPRPSVNVDLQWASGVIDIGRGPENLDILLTRVEQDFPRLSVGGISAETVAGRFRLKHEAAVSSGRKHFVDITTEAGQIELFRRIAANSGPFSGEYRETGERYTATHFLFGFDYNVPGIEVLTSVQMGWNHRFGFEDEFYGEADEVQFTLYAQRAFADEQFTASLSALLQSNQESSYWSPRLRYVPKYRPEFEFTVGMNVFAGEREEILDGYNTYDSTLGSYVDHTHGFAAVSYIFGFDLID